MKLIVNSNPRSEDQSVNLALAQRLAECFDGPLNMIRLYDEHQQYFNYQYNQDWINLLVKSQCLIFPVPMWNLSVPAALKDFLDKVIKRGEVWDLDQDRKFKGLLPDRPAFIIMTSGDFYHPGHPQDFVVPYLRAVLNSIGILTVKDYRIGGVRGDAKLLADKKFMDERTQEMLRTFGLSSAGNNPHS